MRIIRRFLKSHLPLAWHNHLEYCGYTTAAPVFFLNALFGGLPFQWGYRVYGRPIVRKAPGSTITVGKKFVAVSVSSRNAIGVSQPVILTTRKSDAVLSIGDQVAISGCSITACNHIRLGNRVMIGEGVLIIDSDLHPLNPVSRARGNGDGVATSPVVIEDDVFIGARAIVLKGVRIGKAAVVGAGAVVTRHVPAYAIAAGNPARRVGRVDSHGV